MRTMKIVLGPLQGQWAHVCNVCRNAYGSRILGTGHGQRYEEQTVVDKVLWVKTHG